jgi:hypothetical protein
MGKYRLLDVSRKTQVNEIAKAFQALGKRVIIGVEENHPARMIGQRHSGLAFETAAGRQAKRIRYEPSVFMCSNGFRQDLQ